MQNNTDLTFIYVIRAGKTDLYKVGYAKDPAKRLRELQTGNGHKLALLAMWPGDQQAERRIHGALAQYRREGEWFQLSPSQAQSIPAKDYYFERQAAVEHWQAESSRLRSLAESHARRAQDQAAHILRQDETVNQLQLRAEKLSELSAFHAKWYLLHERILLVLALALIVAGPGYLACLQFGLFPFPDGVVFKARVIAGLALLIAGHSLFALIMWPKFPNGKADKNAA